MDSLELKFDPNTIEHLGVSLYSKLPSVLSELVSNSWDADADNVSIDFTDNGDEKQIIYIDDGNGMTFDELNQNYLVIGRNRRKDTGKQTSEGGRPVIGKKGLGKLSVFGICDEIEVISIKDGLKNQFSMNLNDIRSSQRNTYKPTIIEKDQLTNLKSGTTLVLKQVRRKSGFDLEDIALSLSKKFTIFDRMIVTVSKNDSNTISVTNELKFSSFNTEFEWELPIEELDSTYPRWQQVSGTIMTLKTPVKDTEMKGVYLTSRGKIVNEAGFYGLRDTDQFHSYVTGYIEVDFIDDFDDDVISTDRHSLNWEHAETRALQQHLQAIIKKIGGKWRKKRAEVKKTKIRDTHNIEIDDWKNKLPKFERDLSDKIIDPILENSNIDVDESAGIIDNVIGKFENQAFKEYASHIAEISDSDEDIPKLLQLMEDWKSIESDQYRELARSRVEVIKQFEYYLDTNTKEVPTLHNFLKKFSWLLDPRILEFKDEVRYSALLKEEYPETKLEEQDRRIDFLCSNALGEILYVIEIKRSQYKVDYKAIEQAYEYQSFLTDHYASHTGFSRVVCYVVGGSKSDDRKFRSKEQSYAQTGEVFVKTYTELLEQSKEYHKEFIEAYDSHSSD